MKKRYLFPALIALSVVSLFVGVIDLSPKELFSMTDRQSQIFFASRVPRLASIIIAGMSMSIVGLIMQQLTRNKFVSPTTAGTDEAARLGVLVAIMTFAGASSMTKMLIAFAFALAGTYIFMKLLDRVKYKDSIFIPLVGLMFGSIIGSATTFFAYKNDLIQNITSWMQGDFSLVMRGSYELLYLSVPVLIVAYAYANRFTVAGMGESFAVNLGLNYKQVVNIGLAIVALVSAVVLGAAFLALAVALVRETTPGNARRLFSYSLAYLALLFVALAVDPMVV